MNLRYASRQFISHWRLMLTAILSLGVAMTATVVGIGVVNAVMVRPPGVADPDTVLTLYVRAPDQPYAAVSFEEYTAFRDRNQVFAGLAAFPQTIAGLTFADADRREPITAVMVTENYFDVLGVRPVAGRLAFPHENTRASDTAVISEDLWRRLGSDPTLVGRSIRLDQHAVTIIGIVPRTYRGMTLAWQPDFIVPIRTMFAINGESSRLLTDPNARWLRPVGRLRPGVTVEQAQADMARLSAQLASDRPTARPASQNDRVAFLTPTTTIPANYRDFMRPIFGIVIAIVALTLIAAASNVTNLLLALAATRRHEMLVRSALGASRRQLMLPLLGESLLLCILAGTLGFALASLALAWLSSLRPLIGAGIPPPSFDFHPDWRVASIMIGVIFVIGLATGVIPAWRAAADGLSGSLGRESHTVIGGAHRARTRHALVVIQMAVATVILIGVGVSLRSLTNLQHVDVGFTARNLAIVNVNLRGSGYDEIHGRPLYDRMRTSFAVLPGVESVSLTNGMPIGLAGWERDRVRATGDREASDASYAVVDANYFATLGIPLLEGRTFDSRDVEKSPEVIVINRTMARQRWPNQDPIGQRLHIENGNRFATVIGIVADGKYDDLDEPPRPFMYFALDQHYLPDVTIIARTSARATAWVWPITQAMTALDPQLGFGVRTFEDHMHVALLLPLFILTSVSGLGALALMLAIVGLYGTVFYSVSQRRTEIGVRVALGAQPRDLFRLVLTQTSRLALIGAALGTLISIITLPILSSLLFGIRPIETFIMVSVSVLTLLIATLTAYLAARPWMRMSATKLLA
jgi:predicted permease